MSLIYFDGYDQYTSVPEPTTNAKWTAASIAQANLTSVAGDPVPFVMNAGFHTFGRIFGEDRYWRVPGKPTLSGGTQLPYTWSQSPSTATFSTCSSVGYGVQLNALQPVSATESLTFGCKMKYSTSRDPSTIAPMLMMAFSADPLFVAVDQSFGIVMEANGRVYIRRLFSNDPQRAVFNVAWPTNTFVDTTDGFIGTCNFVYGTAALGTFTPAIDVLAANTIEAQFTSAGKITVWVNNQFCGTATFTNPTPFQGVQYVKTGVLAQVAAGSGVVYAYYGLTATSDLYLLNGLGTRNTSRLGKVRVVSRAPQTDSSVQFVRPDTSNTNASVVAQRPVQVNPALTGVAVGNTDLYGSSAFTFSNEAIIATAITTTGYKTDPTGNDIAPVLHVGGTSHVGATNVVPTSLTLMKQEQYIYELNPTTNLPFTKADLDASTFGVTVVAPAS